MSIYPGNYLMWFHRYGYTHLEVQPTMNDVLDLMILLDDCDTCVFDQYGILSRVEHITPDGPKLLDSDALDAAVEERREQQKRDYEASKAAGNITAPTHTVTLKPPSGDLRGTELLAGDEAFADRMKAMFGDRAKVRLANR